MKPGQNCDITVGLALICRHDGKLPTSWVQNIQFVATDRMIVINTCCSPAAVSPQSASSPSPLWSPIGSFLSRLVQTMSSVRCVQDLMILLAAYICQGDSVWRLVALQHNTDPNKDGRQVSFSRVHQRQQAFYVE